MKQLARTTNAVVILVGLLLTTSMTAEETARPNIVLIYADDLGYGDVACNGSSTIATPNLDRLAAEGLRFTDAHCSAATCTPSRFAMLTGSYAFRGKRTGIQPGDANLIIPPGTVTLPERLQAAGYATGVVGKWHLGLGDGPIDWNQLVAPGPEAVGFDYHFLIPATGDRVPCVYLEQGRVVDGDPADPIQVSYGKRLGDAPTGKERPDLLKQRWSHGHDKTIVNGVSRIGYMTGGKAARWVDEDMADALVEKATRFVESHAEEPFFLYFSTHDIHVPRLPHARFVGSTGMGPRGDAIAQLDWCVGALLDDLDRRGLAEETLVLFTSDNGPVLDDGYHDDANELIGDHRPAGPYRAGKYSKFEGGTRVPLLVRWPNRVAAGAVSQALVGQIDFARSLVRLVGADDAESLPDSRDQLAALLGQDRVGRPHLVQEANQLALRQGDWKYLSPDRTRDGLGPWSMQKTGPRGSLFDLSSDPGEQNDVIDRYPDRAESMRRLLKNIKAEPDRPQTAGE